jgi:hypothetical protein
MKKYILLTLFILLSVVSYAQNEAQVIPRRIFTGDPAVLILPLNDTAWETSDIVLSPLSPDFPSHPDIDFRKIIIEQHTGGKRLIIEFTAFAPGILEFPVIKIGGLSFSGLSVTVNSVLDKRSSLVLSGPAATLVMPGTAFMLYGTITGLIIFILLTIWFIIKGRILINNLMERWKRLRLFSSIKKIEKRLSRSVKNGENGRVILDKLSEHFRVFLSVLTGKNCRTMTAREFKKLPLQITQNQNISSSFLHDFFRDCDDLRFSGIDAASQDILYLLACLRRFIAAVENTKKEAA